MKKTVLTFGLISGGVLSLMMLCTVPFMDKIGFDKGMVIGYTTIVLSFTLVYFGIRSYRDNVGGGNITFGKAFAVGILITLISCLCYVGTWEVIYYKFMPDFAEKYTKYAIGQLIASGASTEVIDAKLQEMKSFGEMLDNPLLNGLIAFTEPFPIGLIMTAISAAILRKKSGVNDGDEEIGAQVMSS